MEGGVLDKVGKMLSGSPSVSRTSSGIFDYDREHANLPDPKVNLPDNHAYCSYVSLATKLTKACVLVYLSICIFNMDHGESYTAVREQWLRRHSSIIAA